MPMYVCKCIHMSNFFMPFNIFSVQKHSNVNKLQFVLR